MEGPMRGQDQCKVRQLQILGQDRVGQWHYWADPKQDRAMQRQNQGRTRVRCSARQTVNVRSAPPPPPPPIPDPGRTGSEGGDAIYRSATAPSDPTLAAGAGPCHTEPWIA